MGVVGQDGGEGEQAGAGGDGRQGGRGEAQGQRGHRQGQALELGQVLHLKLLLQTGNKKEEEALDKTVQQTDKSTAAKHKSVQLKKRLITTPILMKLQ